MQQNHLRTLDRHLVLFGDGFLPPQRRGGEPVPLAPDSKESFSPPREEEEVQLLPGALGSSALLEPTNLSRSPEPAGRPAGEGPRKVRGP